jgi:hypothetical protein
LYFTVFSKAIENEKAPLGEGLFRWAREELNLRPHAYQACALTT